MNNKTTVNKPQWVVQEASDQGPRSITDGTNHIKLVTEKHIQGMNLKNTRSFLDSVIEARGQIHRNGTPQAIRSIDFLASAATRHILDLKEAKIKEDLCNTKPKLLS